MMYKNIIDIETTLLMQYKIDPFSLLDRLTVMDMQSYVQNIAEKTKREAEEKKQGRSGNAFAKSIVAMRDMLNYWTGYY